MARNCEGSKAWRHRFHLGKQHHIFLQSLLTLMQGYGEVTTSKYPYLKPLISDYHGGPDQLGIDIVSPSAALLYSSCLLGPYWEQPGRSIVEGLLRDVPAATEVSPGSFSEFRRTFFSCMFITTPCHNETHHSFPKAPHITDVPSLLPIILKKTITWSDFLQYLRSSSALRNFHDKHPEDLERSDGDISERLLRRLVRSVEQREGYQITPEKDQVQVEWPLGLLQVRKSQ